MKKFILIALAVLLALAVLGFAIWRMAIALAPVPEEYIELDGQTYKLTFADDFNGNSLDWRKWSKCPEQQRQDAGCYWDNSMISVKDGNLVVSSAINGNGTPIAGAIRSLGKFSQAGGYFEIRCKLQSAKGFWGAFWLMCSGVKSVDGTAIDGAEIDIFESSHAGNKQINHALHYDGYGTDRKQVSRSVYAPDCYDGEYHTFSLLWTKTAYIFYIDGVESYRIQEGDANYPGCCEKETYLKISSEFGSWAGDYNPSELPDAWYVDYVKVYSAN